MKIMAIVGSPRLDGNTNYLVDQALAEAEKLGAETEKIVISQYRVSPCLGHDNCASRESCTQKDDAGWIIERFAACTKNKLNSSKRNRIPFGLNF